MKILLVTINYWPELTGIGKYTGEMAEWLARHDSDVRVVTAPPYYPAWRVGVGYTAWKYSHAVTAGVKVFRCPLWVPARPSGLKRIVHLASFALSALPITLWQAWRWRPDVVFVVEPPLFCAPAALLAAKIAGARSWLHVQDFEIDAAFALGILQSERLRRGVLAVEAWLMCRFERVSTISERMRQGLIEKGVDESLCAILPNWVELERIKPLPGGTSLRAEWGILPSKVVVLYSGNMGEKQGLEILIEVANRVRNESKLHFVLSGDGAVRPRLESAAKGMSNITFCPLQPIERLNDLLNLADIHVLPQRVDAEDLVLPSKITNMLASGRPVVATARLGTQVAETIKNCGIVVPPGDVEGLSDALLNLAEDVEKRCQLGVLARRLAEDLWDKDKVLTAAFGQAKPS